jgi:hypothetical protein
MSKIITDKEMCQIVYTAVHDPGTIDCADSYTHFLESLADLICEHFGGDHGEVGRPDEDLGWTVSFRVNECVPSDGGVFKDYDKDVTWKDGVEI